MLRKGLICLVTLAALAAATASQGMGSGPAAPLLSAIDKERARAPVALLPRTAFLAPSRLIDVRLSPDGRRVAYLRRDAAAQSVWLLDTATGDARRLLRHSEATRLHWSADSAWLFLESPRHLIALSLTARIGSGVMTLLGKKTGRSILGADTAAANAMLVREDRRVAGTSQVLGYRVLRLVPGRQPRTLFASRHEIADFIPGTDHAPSFVKLVANDHFSVRRVDRDGATTEVLRCAPTEPCALLSSPAAGELLLIGRAGGNFGRLIRLDRSGKAHDLHEDPERLSDLAEVAIDPASRQALFATYRAKTARTFPLKGEMRSHAAAIGRELSDSGFSLAIGRGSGSRWLVTASGDRLQFPRRYLYDPRTRRTREILSEARKGGVPEQMAARKITFSYPGSDGLQLHGFLSLPPGIRPDRAPLIVAVHGGPWGQAQAGYTDATQFLVNRGYIVFEPNFRGSSGHGRSYMLAGGSDFGNGRVQQDIVDGTRFLLGLRIGDPARVGIVGHSFGGSSALLGITFLPELFRVAVAAMPASDIGWTLEWQMGKEKIRAGGGIGMAATLRSLAIDPEDRSLIARLRSESPLANVARLRRPLLIFAGGADRNVPIRSVVDYAARLRVHGHDVGLYVDPKSDHALNRPQTQEQYLYLLGQMLSIHLGGRREEAPPAELRQKLRQNLRAGFSFPKRDAVSRQAS